MKDIFRVLPKKELIEEILLFLQFLGLHDKRIFTKKDILKDKFEEIVTWIEPYYIPCKAERFLHDITPNKQITILRHLLRVIGYDLLVQEKNIYGVKATTYQIYQKYIPMTTESSYLMEFE